LRLSGFALRASFASRVIMLRCHFKASPCHLWSFALRASLCFVVIYCRWSMVVLFWGCLVIPPVLLADPRVETHGRASLPGQIVYFVYEF